MAELAMKQECDAVLLPFLDASSEAEVERLLTELMILQARPIIEKIAKAYIWRSGDYFTNARQVEDIEDVIGEVNLHILNKLRHFHSTTHHMPIKNFASYIKVTTYNACHKYLRQKYPHRTRLKIKLRYLLTHYRSFDLWEYGEKIWVCGYMNWKWLQPLPAGRIVQLVSEQKVLKNSSYDNPVKLLASIFDCSQKPIEFDDLVGIMAEFWKVKDYASSSEMNDNHYVIAGTMGPTNPITSIEERAYLQRLWAEICQLPIKHRQALLLNLGDANNHSLVNLLTDIGITSIRQLAEALDMSIEKLTEIWSILPLDDSVIAKYLNVDRQQVINYRLSARRRLSRRMRR